MQVAVNEGKSNLGSIGQPPNPFDVHFWVPQNPADES